MDNFEQQLRMTFLEEASTLLTDAEQCFLAMENAPNDGRIIDEIFRLAHNLKGSAKAVNFAEFGEFLHELESLLLKVKSKEVAVDTNVVDIFLQCNDLLCAWVAKLQQDPDHGTVPHAELMQRLQEVNGAPADLMAKSGGSGFVIFDEIREAPKVETQVDNKEKTSGFKEESIRVNLQSIDEIINDIGELVILQTVLKQQKHVIQSPLVQKTIDQLAKITRHIQDSSMRLRMVPLSQTFQKMQRVMRDTSKRLGKDVTLHIAGEDTEVDKSFVDNLGDPLVHIIRNAVDHGIESGRERAAAGKVGGGNIWLSAFHQGGKIVIEIRDDGRGINCDRIVAKAKEKGLVPEDAVLSDEAARELLFHPGFSTKNEITDISGRGVGLDVVKTNIHQLKGEIQLDSEWEKGSCFRIVLPLTLAIIDGMIIGVNDSERYILPLSQVHEIFEVHPQDIHAVGREASVFDVRGTAIPLFHLNRVLGRPESKGNKRSVVIVTRVNHEDFAFVADMVMSQQQVVIKQLGKDLKKISGVSGSAILGDGKAALILDLEEIIRGRAA